MIYLKNNSETQELYIPKNGDYQGRRTYKEGYEEGIEYQKSKLSSIEITENGLYQNEDGYSEVLVDVPDLNGDYNEGYDEGKNVGIEEGKQLQKDLLESITITENGTYNREDGYNEVLVDVAGEISADIRTLYAFDNGEYTPNYNHILFDGIAYLSTVFYFNRDGGFTLIFKIPSGVANSTILSERDGIMYIKHEDSNINIKVGDKTGSIAIERDKWYTLEIVGFDTYLLDNEPIPTQGETNLDADKILNCILGSFYKLENYIHTYTDRFQGCINLVIFNQGYVNIINYLTPNQDNSFTQTRYNSGKWYRSSYSPNEGVFTFVEESAENMLWDKALVGYVPKLKSQTLNIEDYDFNQEVSTPEGYDGLGRVTIKNQKQASKIVNDGVNIGLNTITDLEITENGIYTPNMEIIPAVWIMDNYYTDGWVITDIQQQRIEVRFLVTPEMVKDKSGWIFGKSDVSFYPDNPQIFGLEITGDDSTAKAKYYQDGLKQEIDIPYNTWIDFITYPKPDNTELRIIECLGQSYEIENSSTTTGAYIECEIGCLYGNRDNTFYLGMLSYIKVSTDDYNKETTIKKSDDGRIGIGFEYIRTYDYLTYYEFYKNSGFGSVNVNVPQEGGSCNLQERWLDYNSTDELNDGIYVDVYPEEGYDGMSRVVANINPIMESKFEQGKEDVINSLQTLNVTENGTYTPSPMPFLRLDGDDKYELFSPTDVNAFEIKFRVNGDGDTEFISQNENINFIGIIAYPSSSTLSVNWYNKQILINDVDLSEWHTLVVKMLDENARVILDGQVYNDYTETSSYENNEQNIFVYGNIDFEYINFWNTWEEYNDDDIPFFNFKVTPEGLMRYHYGSEHGMVDNIGGGSFQYMEESIEGWKEVVVNVSQEGGSCNLQERWLDYNSTDELNDGIYVDVYPEEGYDGMSRVVANINPIMESKYNEGYEAGISEGASGITSSIVENTYSKLALRTTNVRPTDNFISDKTGLVNYISEEYIENSYISYNQDMQGVVICKQPDFNSPSVSMIKRGAFNWNGINKLHTFTISVFGEDMARDSKSNILELHLHHYSTIVEGSTNITFKTGCFATCGRLSTIVFYDVYNIVVEENAFEGVDEGGRVIVVGTDTSENRAKYDVLMTQLGDGWTLSFESVYRE